ncbi:hypothetical protein Gotur_022496 [Gossypium turneri]
MKEDSRGRPVQKAKVKDQRISSSFFLSHMTWFMQKSYSQAEKHIEILLGKTENFDELMAAAAEERDGVVVEEEQQT